MAKLTIEDEEAKVSDYFKRIDRIAFLNQQKVLNAFIELKVSSQCFYGSTGYGYGDVGRDTLAKLYAKVFGGESAIVSPVLTPHFFASMLFARTIPALLVSSPPNYCRYIPYVYFFALF